MDEAASTIPEIVVHLLHSFVKWRRLSRSQSIPDVFFHKTVLIRTNPVADIFFHGNRPAGRPISKVVRTTRTWPWTPTATPASSTATLLVVGITPRIAPRRPGSVSCIPSVPSISSGGSPFGSTPAVDRFGIRNAVGNKHRPAIPGTDGLDQLGLVGHRPPQKGRRLSQTMRPSRTTGTYTRHIHIRRRLESQIIRNFR